MKNLLFALLIVVAGCSKQQKAQKPQSVEVPQNVQTSQAFVSQPVAKTYHVKLGWNRTPDAYSYRVYYGVHSRQYTNHVTTINPEVTINGLRSKTTYYFTVTSVWENGLEGKFGKEITYTAP